MAPQLSMQLFHTTDTGQRKIRPSQVACMLAEWRYQRKKLIPDLRSEGCAIEDGGRGVSKKKEAGCENMKSLFEARKHVQSCSHEPMCSVTNGALC